MSGEDIPTQALQNARIKGEKPAVNIRISWAQWNYMNKLRTKMITTTGNRRVTYEDVQRELINDYDGVYS